MQYVKFFFEVNLLILLPLVIFGLAYYFINTASSKNIIRCFGWNTYAVIGAIGVPIHELSHLTANIIFNHKVTGLCLYRPKKGKIDGTLGYVKYRYSPTSIYQQIGVFISGIAPMIGGSLVIILLMRLLLPETFSNLAYNICDTSISGIANTVVTNLKNFFDLKDGIIKLVIFIILSCAISLNIDISDADLKMSIKGLVVVEILQLVISIVLAIAFSDMLSGILKVSTVLISILTIGLIFTLISFAISSIAKIIKA